MWTSGSCLLLAPPTAVPPCLVFLWPVCPLVDAAGRRHVAPRLEHLDEDAPCFNLIITFLLPALLKPEDLLLCFRRMETDDVSIREQLFHNRVRETIVSNAGLMHMGVGSNNTTGLVLGGKATSFKWLP